MMLQDGMQVTFLEVTGMEELNDGKPRKVKNCKVSALSVQPLSLTRASIDSSALDEWCYEDSRLLYRTPLLASEVSLFLCRVSCFIKAHSPMLAS